VRVHAPHRRGSVIILVLYYFLAGPTRRRCLENPDLLLKGPNGVTVLFTYVFLDVFAEHDDGVIVLFHATLGTLDACLKPFHNTLGMEHVFALEFLIVPLGLFKTHSTCVGKVCTAHPVFDRLLFALCSIPRKGRAIHVLLGSHRFLDGFLPHFCSH